MSGKQLLGMDINAPLHDVRMDMVHGNVSHDDHMSVT